MAETRIVHEEETGKVFEETWDRTSRVELDNPTRFKRAIYQTLRPYLKQFFDDTSIRNISTDVARAVKDLVQ